MGFRAAPYLESESQPERSTLGEIRLAVESATNYSGPEHSDPGGDVYDDGYLRVEHRSFYVSCGGQPLYHLSRREFLILSLLARAAGRPVTKEQIWAFVWGDTASFNARNFRVHVANLRRKLAPFGLNIIAMVHVGYRLEKSVECREGNRQA
jgi:DNA-binding response OmpR family regulator